MPVVANPLSNPVPPNPRPIDQLSLVKLVGGLALPHQDGASCSTTTENETEATSFSRMIVHLSSHRNEESRAFPVAGT